jgi:hypothetical protein
MKEVACGGEQTGQCFGGGQWAVAVSGYWGQSLGVPESRDTGLGETWAWK